MEILLIIVIGVISAIVSAASKKQKQNDDAPPRPFVSDIQRALSFLNNEDETWEKPQVREQAFQETVSFTRQPEVPDYQSEQGVSKYSSPWESPEYSEPSPSLEGISMWNASAQDDTDLQSPVSIKVKPYAAARKLKKIDKPVSTDITEEPQEVQRNTAGGLNLLFGSNDIIRGVVYSEILSRKRR